MQPQGKAWQAQNCNIFLAQYAPSYVAFDALVERLFPAEEDRQTDESGPMLNAEPPICTRDLRSMLDVGRSAFDVLLLTQEGWLSPV